MRYRLLGAAVGLAVGAALVYGLAALVDVRWALTAGVALGTAVFLVVDGSAGAGEGWIYHRVRSAGGRAMDGVAAAAGGLVLAGSAAGLSVLLEVGVIGSAAMILVGGFLGANAAFLYRRPDYEQQLDEMD